MKKGSPLKKLIQAGKPGLAVLVDPDKFNPAVVRAAEKLPVRCFLVGGSLLEHGSITRTINAIKKLSAKPVLLFPGDEQQLSSKADGLLLLSLLSGQNVDYIIGKHIRAASAISRLQIPLLSTAYLLVSGGKASTTQLVTGTTPLDARNHKLVCATALAARQLGFGAVYLEAGSGAKKSVPSALVKKVRSTIDLPLIVGGGIDSADKARKAMKAGADLVVVGNAVEKNVNLLDQISSAFKVRK